MKKIAFPRRRRHGTIRTRLIVSFSVPVLAVMLLVMIGVYRILLSGSEAQVLSFARSSCDQSYELVSSYIEMMLYASDSIYYNGDLQRILSRRDYAEEMPIDERYREFLVLDDVFSTAENVDVIYRTGIYLRGDIPYTNNNTHIMSLETLFERSDYMRYVYTVRRGRYYFSPPVDIYTSGSEVPVRAVTLLRPVRTTDGSSRQICIEQISVEAETFETALSYAQTTEGSFVYLVDEYRQLIASTDDTLYWNLKRGDLLPASEEDASWSRMEIDGRSYYVLRSRVPEARWLLTVMIPVEDVSAESRYVSIVLIVLAVLVLSAVVFVAIMLSNSYARRLKNLNALIQRVRSGELKISRYSEPNGDEISELFNSFSDMTAELQNLMRAQYRSGKAVKSAELRALQAQINPHFLYNTLDLINWEAFEHDAPEISEIAQNLAKFYRLSLNKGRQILTIREELEHVRAYVSIENRHFDDAICLQIDVPEALQPLACLNIILQPFVENAILHGFAENPARGVCNIRIEAWREGDDVVFLVQDDGPGMTEAQIESIFRENTVRQSSGYGVKNIQSRIRLSFGENYGVTYRNTKEAGTAVYIRIPALTPEEAEKRLSNP